MITRDKLIEYINNGQEVTIQLVDAEIVSLKEVFVQGNARRAGPRWYIPSKTTRIVVKDPVFGTIFFSSFSDKFNTADRGDKISLKVTVTGIGSATQRYPEPMLFAKALTRQRGAVTIARPVVEPANDLPNV